jgi:hypothetical protein
LNYNIKPQKAKTLILDHKLEETKSYQASASNEIILVPKKVSSKTEEAKVNYKELFRKEIDKNEGSKNSQNDSNEKEQVKVSRRS